MSVPVVIPFDPVAFRAMFSPAFNNPTCNPDAQLQMWWDMGTGFVNDEVYGCAILDAKQQPFALNLMAAHIGKLFADIAAGDTPGVLQSATIDKVSVTVKPPPEASQFGWWLNTTPYGAQLLALLTMAGTGGVYVAGIPERNAFRRAYGGFGGIPPGRC